MKRNASVDKTIKMNKHTNQLKMKSANKTINVNSRTVLMKTYAPMRTMKP